MTTARWVPGDNRTDRFHVVRVIPARFFGVRTVLRRGIELRVSDRERTLIDSLNRPEFSGGMAGVAQMFALAKPKLNWSRFGSYLDRFGNRSITLRAGFLAERVRPSVAPPTAWVRARLPDHDDPYVPLGPPKTHGRRGKGDPRWHIIQNVPDSVLFAEGEIS